MLRTFTPKKKDMEDSWHVIDASGQKLGRLACRVAQLLVGKGKVTYAPYLAGGDHVIVVNAAKLAVTGDKLREKMYYRHSGYPGHLKARSLEDILKSHPERVVEHAVRGMLPKTRLGHVMYRRLRVYAGPHHRHQAQVAGLGEGSHRDD